MAGLNHSMPFCRKPISAAQLPLIPMAAMVVVVRPMRSARNPARTDPTAPLATGVGKVKLPLALRVIGSAPLLSRPTDLPAPRPDTEPPMV